VRERQPSSAAWIASLLPALFACVPEGPSTDAGTTAKPAATAPKPRTQTVPAALQRPPITSPFEDAFDRDELGPNYNALSPAWKIHAGRLCARGARNKGVWLLRKIPQNARIEFDGVAESVEGDVKAELWGDGVSGATGTSYTNATSYLAILGGWKNTKHVLARMNEHADDRLELDIEPGSDDERARPVESGQPYHFKVERADGKTVEWSVNGLVYFRLTDDEPLTGAGHEYLGFNDWDLPVCFDNVKVTPL
jgi:hypothetical protein